MHDTSYQLKNAAQKVIADYLSLPNIGVAAPYYNNRRHKLAAGLRALTGKGLPEEIAEEVELFAIREKVSLASLADSDKTRFLVDHHLGVDCSGFVYHVLDAEGRARGKGALSSHISFHHRGLLRRLLARLRPAQNVGVRTFVEEKNSREIALAEARPGDFISMTHEKAGRAFDHILLITDTSSGKITYTHSIAWPSDGEYGHGVRTGTIEVTAPSEHVKHQKWTEQGKTGAENYTHQRALKADACSVRRLKCFS